MYKSLLLTGLFFFLLQDMFPGAPELIQEYVESNKIIVDGGDRFGVSTLCYDSQELLWMGNQGVGIRTAGSIVKCQGVDMRIAAWI